MTDDVMGEKAPQWAQRLHSDNLVTHQRLGDVDGGVARPAVEVRGRAAQGRRVVRAGPRLAGAEAVPPDFREPDGLRR